MYTLYDADLWAYIQCISCVVSAENG